MIYFPKTFGTCIGANRAIKMAYKLKNEFNKPIYIYKEILHNKYIIDMLTNDNIFTIDNLDDLKKDDILLIRAHGEPKSTYEILKKKGIKYYDATCFNVSKIHDIVEEKQKEGYKIIIVGKENHPEVIGTNGHVNNEAIIILDKNDYKILNKKDKYFVISQTTINEEYFLNLIKYLEKNNYNFDYTNTICNYQKQIQLSSKELAKKVDIMFVIGGENSSNTKELYNKCISINKKTYFFSDIDNFYSFISKQKYNNKMKFGFTGGASTLKEQIYEYSNLLEFIIYYKETKKKIEKEMIKFNNKIDLNNNKIVNDAINKFKYENDGGKLVRGTLIDLGYKLKHNDDNSLKLASSYEAFETSILIHDDIIDNSPLRRNKSTIHELYKKEFNNYKKDNTPESLALCLGDIGFFYVNNYIINSYKNNKNLNKILEYYNNIVIDTIKGEILDVYLPYIEKNDKSHNLKEEDIMEIYRLKTAMYTIVGPFTLGMILSGANKKEIDTMKKILEPLGIAFQIKDDILGIFSNDTTLGKPTNSDIEEFKQTILYSFIKEKRKDYLNELLKYYGNKTNNDSIQNVRSTLIESGSLEYANNKMNELLSESKSLLNKSNIKIDIKRILLGFIKFLEIRKK